jgi:hypothetical protein
VNVDRHANLNLQPSRAAFGRICGAIFIVASLIGCLSFRSTTAVPPPLISFTELKNRVIEIRGLSLKRNVTIDASGANGGEASDTALTDLYGAKDPTELSQVYKRIGLLAADTDFSKALADYHRLNRIAYYESRSASVVINPKAASLGRAFSETDARMAGEVPAIFGIVQALEEQHFHWHERMKSITLEDRKLSFHALAVGDAILVALTRVNGNKTSASSLAAEQTRTRLRSAVEKLAADLPDLLREKLVFPYREGGRYVSWAYETNGWEGVNALFTSPPLSTSQILHPEKYYIQKENPFRIYPWGLTRRMKRSATLEQTLGESLIRLLLSTAHSHSQAIQIASGWQGDLLSAYPEDDGLVTAWISSWKSEKEAREFFRAYASVLERLHRIRWQESGRNGELQTDLSAGRSAVMQRKGSMVLLLDGMPSARSLELAHDAWKDLETERESHVIPFETANGKFQLASRRW